MSRHVRIATRKSPMALWQSEFVKMALQQHYPDWTISLVPLSTKGDEILDKSLAKIGGKGLFLKELEQAMLAGDADIAVHSMKDMPYDLPEGFTIAVICERDNPKDALVSFKYASLKALPKGAVVGTSSLRRQAQLLRLRPDLNIQPVRGNVNTRLRKLEVGEYDALVLSYSGLERLGLTDQVVELIDLEHSLPAVGQGAIGIECLKSDEALVTDLSVLNHTETALCLQAERSLSRALNGSCQTVLAGFAALEGDEIMLSGRIGDPMGQTLLEAGATGKKPDLLGQKVADLLIEQGARQFIQG